MLTASQKIKMPPTRGHDLKLNAHFNNTLGNDAPHTGARLETTSG